MKIRLSLLCFAMALLTFDVADAQLIRPLEGGGFARSGTQQFSGDILHRQGSGGSRIGRLWFESNYADSGLGYEGSYASLGMKSRLFEDRLDGRWLFEGRAHHSLKENGGFFANIGIERVFSLESAGADVSVAAWYDFDGDEQNDFSHVFHQVGVTAQIKTESWDLIGNGYIPTGIQDYSLGDPAGIDCFVGNNIVMRNGIDAALQGFDVTLRLRPEQIAFMNGRIDFGGYHYNSDLVDAFGGARVRFGFQVLRGMTFNVEVNHDERFDTTGVIGLGWVFGGNAGGTGSEYSPLGRDLEETVRNDHIVRFNRDVVLAIDPDTGMAYNVVHADNTADAGIGNGTAETPFASLKEAEVASVAGDIIYVDAGDGTDRLYRDGVILKDDQFLLSNGGRQLIPISDGRFFELCRNPGGPATISNAGGNSVVTLAANNVVGGINIDGTGATHGITGTGVAVRGGEIRGNTISGATENGVSLLAVSGNWDFSGNSITANGGDGILINGGLDATSTWNFESNDLNNNGLDGLHMRNYDGLSLRVFSNETSLNGRHGLFLERNIDVDAVGVPPGTKLGSGIDVDIIGHVANTNGSNGMFISEGDGDLMILNTQAINNPGVGLLVHNWTDNVGSDRTFIGSTPTGQTILSGNGAGLSVRLDRDGLVQDVLVTDVQANNNGRGLFASSRGVGSKLNLDVIDNVSFANNQNEGIRLLVDDGGEINNRIENTGEPLNLTGNSINGGGALSYVLGGPGGVAASNINSVVRNTEITGFGIGVNVEAVENTRINLDLADSTITAGTGIAIDIDNQNSLEVNTTYFDNVVIRADVGIFGQSRDGTLWDFSLTNSDIQSNGLLANGEVLDPLDPAAYTPFTDTLGAFGIFITADGGGAPPGAIFDNLTRVNLVNNVVRDFTFEGITLATTGDAQMFTNI
ncbi:MAG: right-handed parallel beta-helix repeat-containing protein, partial [Mariniblastus sp.]|nr:right-handed parallel beta-helix repeat-containing protein [Mariniblastus sp.]